MAESENSISLPGWETVRLLGRGDAGPVCEIRRDTPEGQERAALKRIRVPRDKSEIQRLRKEGYDKGSLRRLFRDRLQRVADRCDSLSRLGDCPYVMRCEKARIVPDDDGFGGSVFIRMELLTPLSEALPRTIPEEQVEQLARELSAALAACQRLGVVHGNIRPRSVFASPTGRFKLGNFSFEKDPEQHDPEAAAGTDPFAAPEIRRGRPCDERGDLYSLGLTLYWLLNERRLPFLPLPPVAPTAAQDEAARRRLLGGELLPPPAHGSPELKRIVLQACAYNPEERYESAEELLEDLELLHTPEAERPERSGRKERPEPEPFRAEEPAAPEPEPFRAEEPAAPEPEPARAGETVVLQREPARAGETVVPEPEPARAGETVVLQREPARAGETVVLQREPARAGEPAAPRAEPEKKAEAAGKSRKSRKGLILALAGLALLLVLGLLARTVLRPGRNAPDVPPAADAELAPSAGQAPKQGISTSESTLSDAEKEKAYQTAEALAREGKNYEAAIAFYQIKEYQDAWQRCFALWGSVTRRDTVAAGTRHTAALKTDGTVLAAGSNDAGQCELGGWKQIVALSAGYDHTLGLKADGTVLAAGQNGDGQCQVEAWEDMVAVSGGRAHSVGLKADGTVLAVGLNRDGQCSVEDWRDIVAVAAGGSHTVGLKADGTVVAVGETRYGQCQVETWRDIVAISAGLDYTLGLRADGTLVSAGDGAVRQRDIKRRPWNEITAISAGAYHTVGLKADGTVLATGDGSFGQCKVNKWTDIVAVFTGYTHTVGLRADGTAVAVGRSDDGQCDVSQWRDLALPAR